VQQLRQLSWVDLAVATRLGFWEARNPSINHLFLNAECL
jgi:hypothetical protein